MLKTFPLEKITLLKEELISHPIYNKIRSIDDLSLFMQHHVFSVWDFITLLRYLRNHLAPIATYTSATMDPKILRFINEIVLEEESDIGIPLEDGTQTYISHFQLYVNAMEEVSQGSTQTIKKFADLVNSTSLNTAIFLGDIPQPSSKFIQTTFEFLNTNKPHVIAAAFTFGREHIIPAMFQKFIDEIEFPESNIRMFRHYLNRHIELDGDHHGPMALKMIDILCDGDPLKIAEAEEAALKAIRARIDFWDGVTEAIEKENLKEFVSSLHMYEKFKNSTLMSLSKFAKNSKIKA